MQHQRLAKKQKLDLIVEAARYPEHRWRTASKPWRETWQLEPLFLVFFLKSIIRNFQYRNNPSKPLKVCCLTGVSHQVHQDASLALSPLPPPLPLPHPTHACNTLWDRHTVVTKITHHLGLNRPEATEAPYLGRMLQDHPLIA